MSRGYFEPLGFFQFSFWKWPSYWTPGMFTLITNQSMLIFSLHARFQFHFPSKRKQMLQIDTRDIKLVWGEKEVWSLPPRRPLSRHQIPDGSRRRRCFPLNSKYERLDLEQFFDNTEGSHDFQQIFQYHVIDHYPHFENLFADHLILRDWSDSFKALHYITLHYITLHYITLHYITLHYITLHYITLHYPHFKRHSHLKCKMGWRLV